MTATVMSPSANKIGKLGNSGLPLVLLGVAGGKRVKLMQAARQSLGLAPARVVEWSAWLDQPLLLEQALANPCIFKIESPGDDGPLHRRLLQDGCDALGQATPDVTRHGEISLSGAWFAGLTQAMHRLTAQLTALPQVRVMNAPADVLLMTDKLACQRHLQEHGVAVPRLLGAISGYDHLISMLDQQGLDQVYLKARYGSSASGVIAYRRNGRIGHGSEQATSSAHLVDEDGTTRLYNVKTPRRYGRNREIRQLVDLLAGQQLYAEAWLAKPRSGDGHYDIRVVTLGGVPAHSIARIGARMMTNLHLGNQRADPASLLDAAGLSLMEWGARQGAAAFPASHVIGFDLVVRHGALHVLEANAFGDLLPGLAWRGLDTYAAQLQTFGNA